MRNELTREMNQEKDGSKIPYQVRCYKRRYPLNLNHIPRLRFGNEPYSPLIVEVVDAVVQIRRVFPRKFALFEMRRVDGFWRLRAGFL